MFLKKIKKKNRQKIRGNEKESVGRRQSSAPATTVNLMLPVGMLGHLSRTPRAKDMDSTVKDLVIPETGERKGGRIGKRQRGQYGTKIKRTGGNRLAYSIFQKYLAGEVKFTDTLASQPIRKPRAKPKSSNHFIITLPFTREGDDSLLNKSTDVLAF